MEEVADSDFYEGLGLDELLQVATLSRLVVDPDHRGTGLPRAFDETRIRAAREAGATVVLAATHIPSRWSDLAAQGFELVGRSRCPRLTRLGEVRVLRLDL
jgi:GNAT superfamily N-acetyltransferase